jgi:hypothetical protein
MYIGFTNGSKVEILSLNHTGLAESKKTSHWKSALSCPATEGKQYCSNSASRAVSQFGSSRLGDGAKSTAVLNLVSNR